MKKILRGPDGLTLELDKSQVFHDDPGNGTPALVVWKDPLGAEFTATYIYAVDMGHLVGRYFCYDLSPTQQEWLEEQEDFVGTFLEW